MVQGSARWLLWAGGVAVTVGMGVGERNGTGVSVALAVAQPIPAIRKKTSRPEISRGGLAHKLLKVMSSIIDRGNVPYI